MKLIFATNNLHKVEEIRPVLPPHVAISSLKEAGIDIDIPEPHYTLEENAAEKALTIYNLTHTACFSEDTGLEVTALGGEPGVRSARYAGDEAPSEKNIDKLLLNLSGIENRQARFRTIICLVQKEGVNYFEGACHGQILEERKGRGGFGYDAVFVPDGASKTFAEMNLAEKNSFSHRKKAVDKLVTFLNQSGINHKY